MRPDLKDLEAVAKKRAKQGLPTPEWENRPHVERDNGWLLDAFWFLCKTRSGNGFTENRLTLVEMGHYLDETCIFQPSQRLTFFDIMLALDAVYLDCSYGRCKGSNPKPQGR